MARILLINGPNLNLLGEREPQTYGRDTLADIESRLATQCEAAGYELQAFQSNAEHEIIDVVQGAKAHKVGFIIINPGAFTHTSIALRDALLAVAVPFIEVHLSNVYARETFRQKSYLSDIALGVITGLGANGYGYAAQAAIERLNDEIKSN